LKRLWEGRSPLTISQQIGNKEMKKKTK